MDAIIRRSIWMNVPFVALQVAFIGMFWTGVHLRDVLLCIFLYYFRMFFISAGYHRYFSHRTYKMGRVMQFLMALGGTLAIQEGVLRWASNHRNHHKYSDTDLDPHNSRRGFWWSHIGWIMSGKYTRRSKRLIKEFRVYPEIMLLERWANLPPTLLGLAVWYFFGASGLFVGFFLSTTILYHGTFLVNSLNHKLGWRRYDTGEDSTNNPLIALLAMGEGWHNNHHHYQSSTAQGFYWYEFDASYWILKGFEKLRLVSDVTRPPKQALLRDRIKPLPETQTEASPPR